MRKREGIKIDQAFEYRLWFSINSKEIHCIELSWHFFIFNPLQKTIGPFISWAYNILNLIVMAAPVYWIRIEIGINKPTNINCKEAWKKRQLEYEYSLWQKIILILLFATYPFYKFALTNCKLIERDRWQREILDDA